MSIRIRSMLVLAMLLQACAEEPRVDSPVVRLFEPDQIASFDTDRWDILKGEFVLNSENITHYQELSKDSDWLTFYTPAEFANDPGSVEVPDLADAYIKSKKGLTLKPDRGLVCQANVVRTPRKTPDDQHVFVECRGSFGGKGRGTALVAQLKNPFEFPEAYWAGNVRHNLAKRSLQLDFLNASNDGRSASKVIKLKRGTVKLLLIFMGSPHGESCLEKARFCCLTPLLDQLGKRNQKEWIHPLVYDDRFYDGVLHPSLLLVPRTSITFREQDITKTSRFGCSMYLESDLPDAVKVTLRHGDGKGPESILFEKELSGETKNWIPLECSLGLCEGRKRKLTLECDWAAKHEHSSGTSPMLFCGAPMITHPQPAGETGCRNLIIVSIDTLRADHLGCYGYPRPTSPAIDRFASENVLFRRVFSQSSYTLPSHVTLFTAQYPTAHGVYQESHVIPEEMELLSETLAKNGFSTASFSNGGFLSFEYGFDQGFDLYCEVDPIGDRNMDGKVLNPNRLSDGSSGSLKMAFDWIENRKDTPFYLFLHTFMVHDYIPPRELAEAFNVGLSGDVTPAVDEREKVWDHHFLEHGWTEKERVYFINMYDACIRAADDMVAELLAHLEKTELKDSTLLVITSDHGEQFKEHGGSGHSYSIYNEVLEIPLIMRVPGFEPMPVEVPHVVNQVDILPTLLDLMGMKGSPFSQGRSCVKMMKTGQGSDRTVFAEVDLKGRIARSCVIRDDWKYIKDESEEVLRYPAPADHELFRLTDDPREQENVAEANPEVMEELKSVIEKMRVDIDRFNQARDLKRDASRKISKELEKTLREQGYL